MAVGCMEGSPLMLTASKVRQLSKTYAISLQIAHLQCLLPLLARCSRPLQPAASTLVSHWSQGSASAAPMAQHCMLAGLCAMVISSSSCQMLPVLLCLRRTCFSASFRAMITQCAHTSVVGLVPSQ